ncbi:hypothetical protein EON80_18015, partial [bacterium]
MRSFIRFSSLLFFGCSFIWLTPLGVQAQGYDRRGTKKPAVSVVARPAIEIPTVTLADLNKITGGPTLLTYAAKGVSPDEVSKILFKPEPSMSGTGEFSGFAHPNMSLSDFEKKPLKPIDVNWNNTPFWDAARDFENLRGSQLAGSELRFSGFSSSEANWNGRLSGLRGVEV